MGTAADSIQMIGIHSGMMEAASSKRDRKLPI